MKPVAEPSVRTKRRRVRRDRRAGPHSSALLRAWRRLCGLFARPMALQRRGWQWHLVLVERRHADLFSTAPSVAELRTELRDHLRAEGGEPARQALRHLMVVHRELGRQGWAGVGALPTVVLTNALLQAEMLGERRPGPLMEHLVERLRRFEGAGRRRDAHRVLLAHGEAGAVEVSEASAEDFERIERSWFDTLPEAPEISPAPAAAS